MNGKLDHRWSIALLVAAMMCLLTAGTVLAASTWVDEIWNMVTFEKATYPTSNFDPYLEKLARIRDGIGRGDQHMVKLETDQFLRMLSARAHGINDVAADELYNFAVSVRPNEPLGTTAGGNAIEGISERKLSVPEASPNTRDDGVTPCVGFKGGACDYWIDDMYDASGG